MTNNKRLLVTNERLNPSVGFGSFEDCLSSPEITGLFDDFVFCAANGRQILLGHRPYAMDEPLDHWIELEVELGLPVNVVFMTKGVVYQRHARTWEEVRSLLAEGYVFSTARHPNIKVWVAGTWRNSRLAPGRIFVLPARSA